MARPASPEASACARIWAVDRGTGASQRPGSLPALRVAYRYSPVDFDRQHHLIKMSVKWRAEMCQLQAGRPTIFSVEATQPTPSPREDQECPREGQCQMAKIPGRPAYERPPGPTLQPPGLSFGMKVKQTDYNCLPSKNRPRSAINKTLIPHL